MKVAGDVGRRNGDRIVLGGAALRLGAEDPRLLPTREDPTLHLGGLIAGALLERLRTVVGHVGQVCQPRLARYWRRMAGGSRQRVERAYAGFEAGSAAEFLSLLHQTPNGAARRGCAAPVYRGVEEIRERRGWTESWSDFHMSFTSCWNGMTTCWPSSPTGSEPR